MQYGNSLYGQAGYGSEDSGTSSQERYIDLMAYLPDYYQSVGEIREMQTAFGYEAGGLRYNIKELLDQCFVSTATWGLDRWEKVYGIQTDRSKSYERRREILMAKLRGSGIATKEMIRNAATAFSGGEVAIQEYPKEHRFVVQFISVKGIPQNMAGLIGAIEEIKPAHLSYSFTYTYTAWGQLNMTWGVAKQKTWGDLRIYEGE